MPKVHHYEHYLAINARNSDTRVRVRDDDDDDDVATAGTKPPQVSETDCISLIRTRIGY